MIYYTIIVMLICLTYLEWSGKDNRILGSRNMERYGYVLMATLLTLVAALRYETGRDWQAYVRYFDNCLNMLGCGSFEPGYYLLNVIFKRIFNDYYAMQFAISVFSCVVMFRYFYKKCEKPIFILLVYFLFNQFLAGPMAAQRQEIAMAIIILGMSFVEKKRLLPWILTVVLAAQFHVGAILAFPLYYTTDHVVRKSTVLLVFVVALAMELFGYTLIVSMLHKVVECPYLPERLAFIVHKYLESDIFGQQSEYGTGLGTICVYLFNLFILMLYNPKKDKYMCNFMIALICGALNRNISVFYRVQHFYLYCGLGISAYGLLDNIHLPKWCCISRKCLGITSFMLLTIFITFRILVFNMGFNKIDRKGSSYKMDYTPYKSFIFRER